MKLTVLKRWEMLDRYRKRLFRKLCFSLITFCTCLYTIKVDLCLDLFFALWLGMFTGVDFQREGFRNAIEDEEYEILK